MPIESPKNIPATVVFRNPNLEHPEGIPNVEVPKVAKNETQTKPSWGKPWQAIKNFRNIFKKENPNPQEPKNQNKYVELIKERLEKVKDFNRLSSKEKALIISLVIAALGAIVASTAFLVPTFAGMTAAGTYGVGVSGTFGTYNYLAMLGTVEIAKSTAGVWMVKSGVAAAGAGLLAGGFGLAKQGDKLTKKYMDKLPPKVALKKPVQSSNPSNPIVPTQPKPKKPFYPRIQIISPENPENDTGEAYRILDLGNLKDRYNNIMGSNQLTETQKDAAVDYMLSSAYIRFKNGAKDVEIEQAIQICLLTDNYEMWQKLYQEIGLQNGLTDSSIDTSRQMFERLRSR